MIDATWFYSEDTIDREICKMLAASGDRMRLQNARIWFRTDFEERYPHLTRKSGWWERLENCHVKYHGTTISVYIRDLSAE